jgi:hypothetical protein
MTNTTSTAQSVSAQTGVAPSSLEFFDFLKTQNNELISIIKKTNDELLKLLKSPSPSPSSSSSSSSSPPPPPPPPSPSVHHHHILLNQQTVSSYQKKIHLGRLPFRNRVIYADTSAMGTNNARIY